MMMPMMVMVADLAQAEEALKQIVKNPESIEALLLQMTQSANPGVRM